MTKKVSPPSGPMHPAPASVLPPAPPPSKAVAHNHSLFGASVLFRRVLCPGSAHMEMCCVDRITEEGAEGDLLHKHVPGPVGARSDNLTPQQNELVDKIRIYRDAHHPREYWTQEEQLYTMRNASDLEVLTWGRTDWTALPRNIGSPDVPFGVVCDWKTGYADLNERAVKLQLGCYGAMVKRAHKLPSVRCYAYNPRTGQEIAIVVSEESGPYCDGLPSISATGVAERVREVIKECSLPTAALIPGESQCSFCRAFPLCPAVHKEVRDLAPLPKDTRAILPSMLAEMAEKVALAKKWTKAAHAFLWEVGRSGVQIPGYVMEEINGAREIEDARLAYARVSSHLTFDEFLSAMKVSITALEEKYIKEGQIRNPGRSGKDLSAEFNLVMGDAIKRGQSTWRLRKVKE